MKHLVEFPLCNALRFLPVEDGYNPLLGVPAFDIASSLDLTQQSEQRDVYYQKWQMQDGICFQLSTNATSIGAFEIYDCLGIPVVTMAALDAVFLPGNQLYGISLTTLFYVFSPGTYMRLQAGEKYYGKIRFTFADGMEQDFATEPFHLEDEHPGTVLFQFRNSYNKGDYLWEQKPYRPSFRVEGAIGSLKLGGKRVVSEDADFSPVLLSSARWRSFELRLGNRTSGVPDWVADKVDAILDCDNVRINGKQYQREENNAVEIKAVEKTAQRDVSVKIREAVNGGGTRYNAQRKALGPISVDWLNDPHNVNIRGVVIDSAGNTYTAEVLDTDITNDREWMAMLATVNGLQPTVNGNGGYFFVENKRLFFVAGEDVEIDMTNTLFGM